ncbi:ParA family protein [Methylobacterium sp. E-065]|uniref:ParA family protein n=1 Tax=Methylobacterium sp. E-065 TaxID=2836583 RepID=UPI001FBB0730|nr:ParA family protein [Methylobacterium sp. E-065]MCJ2020157.1 ParA family protein [Methylobacterium sp. E-065]
MRILSLASQKGGSGKSTLAGSLAVAARQAGERVVVVDLDPQGSLAEWGRQREAKDIVFREVEPNALVRWVAETRKVAAVSLVIIDTAGTFGPEVDAALKQSDFILVPVRPSALDLRAARPTVDRIEALKRRFGFVLNATNPVTQGRTADALAALEAGGIVAPPVADRTDFRDAAASGLGVTEINPAGKAAAEIVALWEWTKAQMESAA